MGVRQTLGDTDEKVFDVSDRLTGDPETWRPIIVVPLLGRPDSTCGPPASTNRCQSKRLHKETGTDTVGHLESYLLSFPGPAKQGWNWPPLLEGERTVTVTYGTKTATTGVHRVL